MMEDVKPTRSLVQVEDKVDGNCVITRRLRDDTSIVARVDTGSRTCVKSLGSSLEGTKLTYVEVKKAESDKSDEGCQGGQDEGCRVKGGRQFSFVPVSKFLKFPYAFFIGGTFRGIFFLLHAVQKLSLGSPCRNSNRL